MVGDSSRKQDLITKEQIINYEYQILEQSTPQVKPTISNSNKYSSWDLDVKIKELTKNQSITTRWIGNSRTAYLQTYAYILLIGSGFSQTSIIEFKHTIYALGKECLNLPEQKLLVEFLCLIEYSRDRYSFLSKYPQIEAIFIKILQFLESEQSNSEIETPDFRKKTKIKKKVTDDNLKHIEFTSSGNLQSHELELELQLEEVYSNFNKHFKFISIVYSNQYCCTLKIFNQIIIHVVIEKDCYFTLEPLAKFNASSVVNEENRHMLHDLEEIMRDQTINETQEVNETQELQIFQTFNGNISKDYEVRESSVVPVERASQIKKPSQEFFPTTPPAPSFANYTYAFGTPNKHTKFQQQLELRFIDNQQENKHDQTIIDELLTPTTPPAANDCLKLPESAKKSKKGQMLQKMKSIQQMKDAIQNVRERIEKKIKVIDEVENFRTEVALKQMQRNSPQKSENGDKREYSVGTCPEIVKQNSVATIKKDRKISCNEPSEFHKKKMMELYNRRTSLKVPNTIHEHFIEQEEQPRSNSKDGPHFKFFYNPTIKQAVSRPLPSGNWNLNVNLSINEGIFSPSSETSISKHNKFPMGKVNSTTYFPQSPSNQRKGSLNPFSFPTRHVNPEHPQNMVR